MMRFLSPLLLLALLAGCNGDLLEVDARPLEEPSLFRLSIANPVVVGPGTACSGPTDPECSAEGVFSVAGTVDIDRWVNAGDRALAVGEADLVSACHWPEAGCTETHRLRADGEHYPWFGEDEPLHFKFADQMILAGHPLPDGSVEGKLLWIHTLGRNGMSYRAEFRLEPVE